MIRIRQTIKRRLRFRLRCFCIAALLRRLPTVPRPVLFLALFAAVRPEALPAFGVPAFLLCVGAAVFLYCSYPFFSLLIIFLTFYDTRFPVGSISHDMQIRDRYHFIMHVIKTTPVVMTEVILSQSLQYCTAACHIIAIVKNDSLSWCHGTHRFFKDHLCHIFSDHMHLRRCTFMIVSDFRHN